MKIIFYILFVMLSFSVQSEAKLCVQVLPQTTFFSNSDSTITNESIDVEFLQGGRIIKANEKAIRGDVTGKTKAEHIIIPINKGKKTISVCTSSKAKSLFPQKEKNSEDQEKITGIRASLMVHTKNGNGYGIQCNSLLEDNEYYVGPFNKNINVEISIDRVNGKGQYNQIHNKRKDIIETCSLKVTSKK